MLESDADDTSATWMRLLHIVSASGLEVRPQRSVNFSSPGDFVDRDGAFLGQKAVRDEWSFAGLQRCTG